MFEVWKALGELAGMLTGFFLVFALLAGLAQCTGVIQ